MPELRRFGMYAGVIDSTASSLASFLGGLIAIWTLDQAALGVYAVFFSAFLTASYLPRQFRFVPVEMASVIEIPRESRAQVARRSLISGLPSAAAAAALTLVTIPLVGGMGSPAVIAPLALTTAIVTFVSPLQDHTRRLFHLAGRSWHAGWISIVHLAVVAILTPLAVGPFRVAAIPPGWLPLGVLAAANVISLTIGIWMVGRGTAETNQLDLTMRRLRAAGFWLGGSALATKGSGFAATALIGNLAGASVLGIAEAARVAAQPVMVLGIGLQDAVSPRLMEAGARGDAEGARRGYRTFFKPFAVLGLAYLAVAGPSWPGNPMSVLVPGAYDVRGLVAVTVLANLVVSAVYPYRLHLLGASKHKTTAVVEMVSALVPVAVALSAPITQAFSRPLGLAGQGIAQIGPYHARSRRLMSRQRGTDEPLAMGDRP